MMIYRYLTPIIGALLSLNSFNLNAQGFSVVIDSVAVQAGQEVCVPIRTKGFTCIVSFQYALTWDSQVLSLDRTQNFHLAGLSGSNFNFLSPNHLLVGWSDPSGIGISKPDGEILYEVCFLAIGPPGASTIITADSSGLPIGLVPEVFGCLGQNIWSPSDTGLVVITPVSATYDALQRDAIGLLLSPNPTQSSTQVIFQSPSTGNSVLLVTDALGRIVFQQKITENIGENRFEIPANALKAKGIYQISLQSKDGVHAQQLSVK